MEHSLGMFIVWTATSKCIVSSIDLSSWVVIFTGSVFVPLFSTWTVATVDFDTSSWVNYSKLFFNAFLSSLSFLVWLSRLWLWFLKLKSSLVFDSSTLFSLFWLLSFSSSRSLIYSNKFLLRFFKRKFSSSCSDKCCLSSFFQTLVLFTCASNFLTWSLRREISSSFSIISL